jgi:GDP-mannose 6-dehydrogenase
MRISIFGLGYVGVVSGACLAKYGHEVIGVDINPGKVGLINAGRSPIVESGVDDLVAEMVKARRLVATLNTAEAVTNSDLSFVSVGTPSLRNGATALDAIDSVVEQIGRAIKEKRSPHTVVVRSTVPPGTIEQRVLPALCHNSGREIGDGLELCSNPEFLREGTAVRDFGEPAYTLVGCAGEGGFRTMQEVYAPIKAPMIRTDIRTAEAIKYLCNIFHALKIDFANEVGALLKCFGIDSRTAMKIFCQDQVLNISPAYLRPGFAFGGSCLPKDVRAFLSLARAQHVDLPLIGNVLASNEAHIDRAFQMIVKGGRRKVALFGLAFKHGTDDMRESPLVVLAERLIGKGFELTIFDRHVDMARLVGANREYIDLEIPHLERLLQPTPEATLDGAGVIVVGHVEKADIAAIIAGHRWRSIVDLQGIGELQRLDGAEYQGVCW